jgi:hypothetical protein
MSQNKNRPLFINKSTLTFKSFRQRNPVLALQMRAG